MNDPGIINDFRGPFRWLSNFEMCPVMFEGDIFPSSEHAYQAAKCTNRPDRGIFTLGTCAEARKRGNNVPLRYGWDEMRLWVMETILRDKFTRNPQLGKKLILTGRIWLAERNTWGDCFWGIYNGAGSNHLGELLMLIRNDLQAIAMP